MHNLHKEPFDADEPVRRLKLRGGAREYEHSVTGPTKTVEAELWYGELKYRVRILPGGVLEVWVHGADHPQLLTVQTGAVNTVELWPHELFDGPTWKHPEPKAGQPAQAEEAAEPRWTKP